ncbi:hypothetical protein [Kitasatospora sp. GAS204B]|uniref:hypothetical protein n=1 Tax=unclassified Kitasatospora TaxID=2633591 RepID=UPI002474D7F0|nr:hypothetical protein [Kitasatospora sp. GAS204B]MDH6116587.1 hypothetical protein [Kitasatospora sp. GAS204B]
MADNDTPIALPEQADEADSVLTGAIQATEQAADQQVEPAEDAGSAAAAPARQREAGTVQPDGLIVNTH